MVADTAQVALGHGGMLAVHVPLGIATVVVQLAIAVRALSPVRQAPADRAALSR